MAAAAVFLSGKNTVEVAPIPPSTSSSSYSRCCGSRVVQELQATNEKKDLVPWLDCVTHLCPEPVGSRKIILHIFALRSLMERGRGGASGGDQEEHP